MPELTALDCVRVLATPVLDLGARWMFHPETLEPAKQAGYPNGFAYYVAGRGGVLGDVDADVVVAAFGYFAPGLVRKMWEAGTPVEGARAAGHRYGAACAAWGRSRLVGLNGLDRLAELAERVIDNVPSPGLSLFAGWRAEPRPDDAAGRAYFCLHLLRELRGGVHLVATTASGLTALESILAAPLTGGPERAKTFGWPEPFPDHTVFVARREAAETLTDELLSAHFHVLDADQRGELADLVLRVKAALDAH